MYISDRLFQQECDVFIILYHYYTIFSGSKFVYMDTGFRSNIRVSVKTIEYLPETELKLLNCYLSLNIDAKVADGIA